MDATLTIQVRVLGAQAVGQLKQVQRAVAQANAAGAGMGAGQAANAGVFARSWASAGASVGRTWAGIRRAWTDGTNTFNRTIKTLDRQGQALRRSGQQITFGFTVPFAMAAGAAMSWALDNERAMTQVEKVYGDHTYTTARVKAETEELAKTFELLSGIMGVNQKEVIDIGAAWAGTGLAGKDLAMATRATLEAMILGEMDAEKATNALVSIMATWRTSTDSVAGGFSELTDALAILNSTENQTGARFADLVDVFDRAGGAARQAGVKMEELAALGASLVPATGSGAAAGNAIKSIVSRIMAPTGETESVLNQIGIITSDPKWMSATATQKIERMAEEFMNLDQATRNVVTSTVAGRWQLNRFDVMMTDIASKNGMYAKAMDATSDVTRRQGTYLEELNAVMDSNPKKMDVLTNVLKNNLSKAFIQFIPILLGVMNILGKLAMGFNNLSPGWKSLIMGVLTAMAVLGPILMLLGVFATSLKTVFMALKFGGGIFGVVTFTFKLLYGVMVGLANAIFTTLLPALGALVGFIRSQVLPALSAFMRGMVAVVKVVILAAWQMVKVMATWAASAFGSIVTWVASLFGGAAGASAATAALGTALVPYSYTIHGYEMATATAAIGQTSATGAFVSSLLGLPAGVAAAAGATAAAATGWVTSIGAIPLGTGAAATATAAAGSAFVMILGQLTATVTGMVTMVAGQMLGFSATLQSFGVLVGFSAIELGAAIQTWSAVFATLPLAITATTTATTTALVPFGTVIFGVGGIVGSGAAQLLTAAGFLWTAAAEVPLAIAASTTATVTTLVPFAAAVNAPGGIIAAAAAQLGIAVGGFAMVSAQVPLAIAASTTATATTVVVFVGTLMALPTGIGTATAAIGAALVPYSYVIHGFEMATATAAIGMTTAVTLFMGSMAALPTGMLAITTGTAAAEATFAGTLGVAPLAIGAASAAVLPMSAAHTAALATIPAGITATTGATIVAQGGLIASLMAIPAAIAGALGVTVSTLAAIVAAVVAVIATGLLLIFNDDFRNAVIDGLSFIGRAIWGLPKVFANALSSLLRIVASAVTKIMDWLSYLNPFQRHSPSLVDNVKAGVATILSEYSRLRGISGHILAAASAHQRFQDAISGAKNSYEATETAEQRGLVAQQAPQALPAFDAMVSMRAVLRQDLIPLSQEIARQTALVARLQAAYNALDKQVSAHERTLDGLQKSLDAVTVKMDAAQAEIDRWSSMGISGMRGMEDAIFENEMAQKRLRLEMMKIEDAIGPIEDIQSRFAALNGEIEMLTGERRGLWLSGAGSDILQTYDDQIDAVKKQRAELSTTGDEITRLQKEMDLLGRKAEMMELEKSIRFDEGLRQIQQLTTAYEEMPLDTIVSKIKEQQAIMAQLKPQQDLINVAIGKEKALLDAITAKRDELKYQLDAEVETLAQLEEGYSAIEQLISDMTSDMKDFASAAKTAMDAADGGSLDGIYGDYEVPTGTGSFDTNSTLAEIEELNKLWEKELEDILGDMPDPFADLRKKWDEFVSGFQESVIGDVAGWLGRNFSLEGIKNAFGEVTGWIKRNFSVEGLSNIGNSILSWAIGFGPTLLGWLLWPFQKLVDFLWPVLGPIVNIVVGVWNTMFMIVSTVLGALWAVVQGVWNAITTVIVWAWQNVIYPTLMALWNFFYTYIFPVFQLLWGIVQIIFTLIYKLIEWVVLNVILPVLAAIIWAVLHVGDIISWLWNNIVKPVFNFIAGIVKWVWENVIRPVFNAIWGFIKNTLGPIFSWLWNTIISPVFTWIGDTIKRVWENIILPALFALGAFIQNTVGPIFEKFKDLVGRVWDGIVSFVKTGAENMANFVIDGVNRAIWAFNELAKGVKWVGDKLGIKIEINEIPKIPPAKFAKGGIPPVDDNGGLYSGVRAIVGEGSKVWPEYVIPTDPQYRGRATSLLEDAANRIGLFASGGKIGVGRDTGVGVGDGGGVFDKAKDTIMGGIEAVKNLGREAARLAFQPIKTAANFAADALPIEVTKGAIRKTISMIDEWISKSEPVMAQGDPGSLNGWKGKPGSYKALIQYMQQSGVPHKVISTIRPGATTRGSGNTRASLHSMSRAVDLAPPGGGRSNDGLLAIYRAFLPVRNLLTELIYSGPGGSNPTNPITRADHYDHVHVGLAAGGRVGKRIHNFADGGSFVPHGGDGILARIGEGMHDERVQIMPLRGNESSGGGDTYIDIDKLVLPNITSPDDAQELLDNLKAIA